MGKNKNIVYVEGGWPHTPDKSQGYDGEGWYFWDETEAFCNGPYKTYNEANAALREYAEQLERGAFTT